MPKRLAITIAGAVSLGSYEAGVLYEIIRAIGAHNTDPETLKNDAEKIEIDVLSGASAGGMTAVIAAQNLLYDGASMAAADNNPFYNPWVADISLDGLLKLDKKPDPDYPDIPTPEDPSHSIFSSNLIEKLARKYISRRYDNTPPKPAPHPAAAGQIRLGLALSNLNGVAYSYPLIVTQPDGGNTFGYARFQDEMTGVFKADGGDGMDNLRGWEPWREAAVSCGAFPFAFRVKELERKETEYTREHLDKWDTPVKNFAYSDGGIFQNEPLGLAKNLVDLIDRPPGAPAEDYQNADSRFYLYVAPGAKTSDVNNNFSADKAEFLPTGEALVSAIIHQAKFQDWVNAEEINDQINIFNIRAEQLFQAIRAGQIQPQTLQAAADALLPGLFQTEPPPRQGVRDNSLQDAEKRLMKQFDKESAVLLKMGEATLKAWIDSILVLETAAELNMKDEMYIYGITATNKELAGGGMFAFEGFFDPVLRQHDYNLGRQKARQFLLQHAKAVPERVAGTKQPPPDIGPIRYHPTDTIPDIPVPARDPQTGDVLISKLSPETRQHLLDTSGQRVDEIVNEVLAALKVNFIEAWLARSVVPPMIKAEIKKLLSL